MSGVPGSETSQRDPSEQAAVLERVKRAELDAKAKLEEAASQADKVKAEARAEAERIIGEAEARASKLSAEIINAGRTDTDRELERIRREAAGSAEQVRRRKEKKIGTREIILSVLGI